MLGFVVPSIDMVDTQIAISAKTTSPNCVTFLYSAMNVSDMLSFIAFSQSDSNRRSHPQLEADSESSFPLQARRKSLDFTKNGSFNSKRIDSIMPHRFDMSASSIHREHTLLFNIPVQVIRERSLASCADMVTDISIAVSSHSERIKNSMQPDAVPCYNSNQLIFLTLPLMKQGEKPNILEALSSLNIMPIGNFSIYPVKNKTCLGSDTVNSSSDEKPIGGSYRRFVRDVDSLPPGQVLFSFPNARKDGKKGFVLASTERSYYHKAHVSPYSPLFPFAFDAFLSMPSNRPSALASPILITADPKFMSFINFYLDSEWIANAQTPSDNSHLQAQAKHTRQTETNWRLSTIASLLITHQGKDSSAESLTSTTTDGGSYLQLNSKQSSLLQKNQTQQKFLQGEFVVIQPIISKAELLHWKFFIYGIPDRTSMVSGVFPQHLKDKRTKQTGSAASSSSTTTSSSSSFSGDSKASSKLSSSSSSSNSSSTSSSTGALSTLYLSSEERYLQPILPQRSDSATRFVLVSQSLTQPLAYNPSFMVPLLILDCHNIVSYPLCLATVISWIPAEHAHHPLFPRWGTLLFSLVFIYSFLRVRAIILGQQLYNQVGFLKLLSIMREVVNSWISSNGASVMPSLDIDFSWLIVSLFIHLVSRFGINSDDIQYIMHLLKHYFSPRIFQPDFDFFDFPFVRDAVFRYQERLQQSTSALLNYRSSSSSSTSASSTPASSPSSSASSSPLIGSPVVDILEEASPNFTFYRGEAPSFVLDSQMAYSTFDRKHALSRVLSLMKHATQLTAFIQSPTIANKAIAESSLLTMRCLTTVAHQNSKDVPLFASIRDWFNNEWQLITALPSIPVMRRAIANFGTSSSMFRSSVDRCMFGELYCMLRVVSSIQSRSCAQSLFLTKQTNHFSNHSNPFGIVSMGKLTASLLMNASLPRYLPVSNTETAAWLRMGSSFAISWLKKRQPVIPLNLFFAPKALVVCLRTEMSRSISHSFIEADDISLLSLSFVAHNPKERIPQSKIPSDGFLITGIKMYGCAWDFVNGCFSELPNIPLLPPNLTQYPILKLSLQRPRLSEVINPAASVRFQFTALPPISMFHTHYFQTFAARFGSGTMNQNQTNVQKEQNIRESDFLDSNRVTFPVFDSETASTLTNIDSSSRVGCSTVVYSSFLMTAPEFEVIVTTPGFKDLVMGGGRLYIDFSADEMREFESVWGPKVRL